MTVGYVPTGMNWAAYAQQQASIHMNEHKQAHTTGSTTTAFTGINPRPPKTKQLPPPVPVVTRRRALLDRIWRRRR